MEKWTISGFLLWQEWSCKGFWAAVSFCMVPHCPQQDGPLGDHWVVQSLPVTVLDLYCGDAIIHDAVVHGGLWLTGLDCCLMGACRNVCSRREKGWGSCPIVASSLAAGIPDCDGGFEQRLVHLVGIHHACDSEPEKRLIMSWRSTEKKGKGRGWERSGKRDRERCSRTI